MSVPSRPASRYQRRILAWGAGAFCLLFVVGAPIYLDRIEHDLTDRVGAAVDTAGFAGVTVSFSGQTATVSCSEPLGDPQALLETIAGVRGVHTVTDLPDACRVRPADGSVASTTIPATPDSTDSTTTSTPVADFGSVAAIVSGSPQFSLLGQLVQEAGLVDVLTSADPVTLFAPTDTAFDELPADAVAQLRGDPALLEQVLRHHVVAAHLLSGDLTTQTLGTLAGDELEVTAGDPPKVGGAAVVDADIIAANGVVHAIDHLLLPDGVDLSDPDPLESVVATFDDGRLVLEGVVRSEVERAVLLDAARPIVGDAQLVDELTTDPDVGLDESTAQALGRLIVAMSDHLVSGTAGFDGSTLFVSGTYRSEDGRDAVAAAAAEVGASADLEPRPDATEDDAVDLEAEMNAYVAEHPILFEPSSSVLDESALPILDEIARLALEFDGVSITVRGHTDSDGIPIENLALSQRRAEAVLDALVERGLDAASLTAEGLGSSEPILVDGVEDKAASRRVEFRVEVGG